MAAEKFYDILINELKIELKEEVRAELSKELFQEQAQKASQTSAQKFQTSYQPPLEVSLSPAIEIKTFFSKKNPYPKSLQFQKRPKVVIANVVIEKRLSRELTSEEFVQFEIFVRMGAHLTERYSELELKKEFRKLALKYHPDHQVTLDAAQIKTAQDAFNKLKSSYDNLCKTLEK